MKRLPIVLLNLLAAALLALVFAQSDQTDATRLLERVRAAHGGDALAALENLREVATLTYYGPGGEAVAELRAEILVDVARERLRLELFEGETLVVIQQLSDGGGVTWTPQTGALALPALQEAELRESFLRAHYGLRLGAEARDEVALEGEATFADVSGQLLRVTTQGVSTPYLIGEDNRLLGERYPSSQLGEVTALYEDYREVGGVLLPHASRLFVGEALFASTATESFVLNLPLDDTAFALP